jgi:uncharacterized protein YbjT (DUF2867 family)
MFVIAGVSGHVGSVVAEKLLEKKQKVRVLVRDAKKGEPWARKGAEVAVASLDDPEALKKAFAGAEGAFVLVPPNMAAPDYYAYARKISDSVAAAVKAAGVPHVAMLSSVGAEMDRDNGPIKTLNYMEKALRESGTALSAIRAGYFQENVGMAVGPARAMGTYFNLGTSHDYAFPMIATRDIGALAAEQLAARPRKSEAIDLHGPSYSHAQVAEKLGKAVGMTLKIVDIPEAGWVEAMMQGGLPRHMSEVYAEMYRGFAAGKIAPRGDRLVQGWTEIDEVIRKLV